MSDATKYHVLSPLPVNEQGSTLLAVNRGLAGFRKLVVLRRVSDTASAGTLTPDLRAATSFTHSAIASIFDVEVVGDVLHLVYEFCPGATLGELCAAYAAAGQVAPLGLVLRVLRDAAVGLSLAHGYTDPLGRQRSVVHHCLADRSLLVTFDGKTKVLDFARPAPAREDPNLDFRAPEEISSGHTDGRSNIFSLGAVGYYALTGKALHFADTLAHAPSSSELPPPSQFHPDAPADLDAVLLRALYPTPERRQSSMLELVRELDRVASAILFKPDDLAAEVRRLFGPRREELRAIANAEDLRETTAVMAIGKIMDVRGGTQPAVASPLKISRPPVSAPFDVSPGVDEEVDTHTGSPREQVAADLADVQNELDAPALFEEQRPTGPIAALGDEPAQGPPTNVLARPSGPKAIGRLTPPKDEHITQPPQRVSDPGLAPPPRSSVVAKLVKGFVTLLMLAAIAGALFAQLNPTLARQKLRALKGALGITRPTAWLEDPATDIDAEPVADAEPAADAGPREAPDAGDVALAGEDDALASLVPQGGDAGAPADAGAKAKPPPKVDSKKRKHR